MKISQLKENVISSTEAVFKPITSFVRGNPITSSIVGGSVATLSAVGLAKGLKSTTKRKKRKSKTKKRTVKRRRATTKRRKRCVCKRKRRVKHYKYARTAGKRRDTSTRRIRMTKNGQPYVILRSGKARFIKRSSARRSRKLKGGRY